MIWEAVLPNIALMHYKKYLNSITDERELVIVSFFITNPIALMKLKKQWERRDKEHKSFILRGQQNLNPVSSETFGGSICLIDPQNLKIGFLTEIKCPVATGLFYRKQDKTLYVGSNKFIRKIRKGQIVAALNNHLFNDIHHLDESINGNLLVVSTGVDGILELDFTESEKNLWDWLAPEHGYNKTPSGLTRMIDRTINYQKVSTVTPLHTTHINSCLEYKPGKILATLFHQGTLIEIDKRSGESKVILRGLKCPHFIRTTREGYLVSDTLNNRVFILDRSLRRKKIFEGDYNWLQDTIELSDGSFLLGDSNNTRIVHLDSLGRKIDIFQMPQNSRKIFSFLKVSRMEALQIFGIKAILKN